MASLSFPVDILARIRGYIPDGDDDGPLGSDRDFVRCVVANRGAWNAAREMLTEMRERWNEALRRQAEMDREEEAWQAELEEFYQQSRQRRAVDGLFPLSFRQWMAAHGLSRSA